MASRTGEQSDLGKRHALRRARVRLAEIAKEKQFHAFVSFSGHDDQRVALRLARALSHIGAWWLWPWQRRMNIYVDVFRLGAGRSLPDSLRQGLDDSDQLILLASPESKDSGWVREELTHWRATDRPRELLGHTGGKLAWRPGDDDFDWGETTALAEDLFRGRYPSTPTWVRLAEVRGYRFRKAHIVRKSAALIAAGIVGVEPRDLWRSEIARRRKRLLALGSLITAVVVAIGLAIGYASKAETAVRLTVVQQLLANASERAGRLDVALLLTGQAYLADRDSIARDRLFELAVANPGLRAILHPPSSGIGAVTTVAFSPDGQSLAAATKIPVDTASQPAVLVWRVAGADPPTQRLLPAARGATATSVAFDPSGTRLAVGLDRGSVAVLTVQGDLVTVLEPVGESPAVKRVSFSRDGRLLAVSYETETTVWNVSERRLVSSFPGTATAFGPATVASVVPASGELVLRDLARLDTVDTIKVGLVEPTDLSFQPDGSKIAVSTGVTRTDRGKPAIAVVDPRDRSVHGLGNTLGTSSVAYGTGDAIVTTSAVIESASSPNPLVTTRNPGMAVHSVASDPAGGIVSYGGTWRDGETGAVMLFDARPTTTLAATSTRASAWRTSALSPDGKTLAHTTPAGIVALTDATTGAPTPVQPQPGVEAPASLAFSPDGKWLAGANNGRRVTLWTVADGVAHDSFGSLSTPDGASATGLAFSPDARTLAVATKRPPGVELRPVKESAGPVLATGPACDLAFSPDGRHLAVATAEGAQLWDLDSNQRTKTIPPASNTPPTGVGSCTGTVAVRFALNGSALVTAGGTAISVTHLDSGRTENLPPPEFNPAGYRKQNPNWHRYAHLGVSRDGTLLAASGIGSGIFLWDLTTMRQVGPMLLSDDQVSAVQFSTGGDRVAALGAYLTTWNIDPDYWLAWMCRTVRRELTPTEWQQFGAGTQLKECS